MSTDFEERIAEYLRGKMPHVENLTLLKLERLYGGIGRETYELSVRWEEEGKLVTREFILRRDQPAGVFRDTEVSLENEYNAMKVLYHTEIPVPRTYWFESDPKWFNRNFMIEEKLPGIVALETVTDSNQREKLVDQFIRYLAMLHTLDVGSLGLPKADIPTDPRECTAREIAKWERAFMREKLEDDPLMVEALVWLKKTQPKKVQRISLLWGDPGPGNFLFEGDKIIALLDWDMSHIGDPMSDIGWICWRGSYYEEELIPAETLFRLYEKYSGLKIDQESLHYFKVFGLFVALTCCITGKNSFCTGRNLQMDHAAIGMGTVQLFRETLIQWLGL